MLTLIVFFNEWFSGYCSNMAENRIRAMSSRSVRHSFCFFSMQRDVINISAAFVFVYSFNQPSAIERVKLFKWFFYITFKNFCANEAQREAHSMVLWEFELAPLCKKCETFVEEGTFCRSESLTEIINRSVIISGVNVWKVFVNTISVFNSVSIILEHLFIQVSS